MPLLFLTNVTLAYFPDLNSAEASTKKASLNVLHQFKPLLPARRAPTPYLSFEHYQKCSSMFLRLVTPVSLFRW